MAARHESTEPETRKPTARSRRRARRTREILETSMDIVVEEGFSGFTMHRLAAALDVAVGGLYRYFASKDIILAELQRLVIEEFREALERALEASRSSLPKGTDQEVGALFRVLLIGRTFVELSRAVPARFRLLAMAIGDPREFLDADAGTTVVQAALPALQFIARLIEEAEICGAIDGSADPFDRTLTYWAAISGVMQLRKLARFAPDRIEPVKLARRLPAELLRGWGGNDGLLDAACEHLEELFTNRPDLVREVYPTE